MNPKWLLCSLLLPACADPDPPRPDSPPPVERTHVLTITPSLDLLFVIDDSASMQDKQNAFNRAFPALLAQLETADGGLPNLHIGVVSSDMGTSAGGTGTPGPNIGAVGQGGCAGFGKEGKLHVGTATVDGKYLEVNRNGTDNFTGTISEAFDAMSRLGSLGCGFEQTLGAMRTALDNNPANTGFVRESANLGVIVLSDEDDCTATDPALFGPPSAALGALDSFRCFRHGVECAEDALTIGVKTQCRPRAASPYVADVTPFKDFLLGLKQAEARRVMFGAIVADPTKVAVELRAPTGGGSPSQALDHACDFTTINGPAVADPGVRFGALAAAMPRNKVTSICNDDLTAQATQLGQALKGLVNDTCLVEPLAPATDCVVTDHLADGTILDVPFRIVDDASCPGAQQRVQLARTTAPAFDTYATLSCAPPSL
jgi:hypothetical protein